MKRSPKVEKKNKGGFVFTSPAEANLSAVTKELKIDDTDDSKAKAVVYNNGSLNSTPDAQNDLLLSPITTSKQYKCLFLFKFSNHSSGSSDVNAWSKRDVASWLRSEGFSDYVALFDRHNITGEVLLTLSEDDLRNPPLNMSLLGDIKLLNKSIHSLKPRSNSLLRRYLVFLEISHFKALLSFAKETISNPLVQRKSLKYQLQAFLLLYLPTVPFLSLFISLSQNKPTFLGLWATKAPFLNFCLALYIYLEFVL